MNEKRFVQARPIEGSLRHAIVDRPNEWHTTAPRIVITFNRALCGVGVAGMRVELDEDLKPKPFKTVFNACPQCRRRVKVIKERS